jgi:hypothetical protein
MWITCLAILQFYNLEQVHKRSEELTLNPDASKPKGPAHQNCLDPKRLLHAPPPAAQKLLNVDAAVHVDVLDAASSKFGIISREPTRTANGVARLSAALYSFSKKWATFFPAFSV